MRCGLAHTLARGSGLAAAALVAAFGLGSPTPVVAQDASNGSQAFAPLPDPPKINVARARLGELLFFDARLSGDTSHSCASCHDPASGWGTGEPMSHGYTGVLHFRNSPGLFNVAQRTFLTWDGRLDGADLGTLVRDMITEAHTMNMDTRLAQERLKQVPDYAALTGEAFGGDPYGGKIYGAIAEFLKTIRTVDAPFDALLRGDAAAIDDNAKRGMELFAGKAGCSACHHGAMLSDGKLHATGVPDHPELTGESAGSGATHAGHKADPSANPVADRQIAMLRHYATMGVPNYMSLRHDVGHYVVSKDPADIGKFVTPSLWDVGQTAPYMHSGVLATLGEVIEFYDAGGGTAPDGSPRLAPLGLTSAEKADLLAFLATLDGERPQVQPPALPGYAMRVVGQN